MVEGFRDLKLMFCARDSSPTAYPFFQVHFPGLALMTVARCDLVFHDLADVHPMVRFIGGEVIDISYRMRGQAIAKLLRQVERPACACQCVQGTDANGSMVRMDFIAPPGVKSEDHIGLSLTNHESNLASELRVPFEKGHGLNP